MRSRIRAVTALRREQERLLAEVQDAASASEASSALLRETTFQLQSVIDAVTEQAIVGTDPQGRIDVFNSGAQRMFQIAAHDVIGRRLINELQQSSVSPVGSNGGLPPGGPDSVSSIEQTMARAIRAAPRSRSGPSSAPITACCGCRSRSPRATTPAATSRDSCSWRPMSPTTGSRRG